MKLPVPPTQIRNALSDRERWASFVEERVGNWRRRLHDFGPEELRRSAEDLRRRIYEREARADDVMKEAVSLGREIASYAYLDEDNATQQLRRIVHGLPRRLLEEQDVYSEAAPGDRDHIERLARRTVNLRRKNQHEQFSLWAVEHVLGQYMNGSLTVDDGSTDGSGETDLHPSTEKYLRIAHEWIKAGNRPDGNKPTELWAVISEETGNNKRTVRETFKNQGWYDPYAEPTPTEHTIGTVRDAYEKHFG